MNKTIEELNSRKSVRSFLDRPISEDLKDIIINSALEAPTAGNQILYSIIDIEELELKQKLSVLCDNQPFISKAPFVLVFVADCKRWLDAYYLAGETPRDPGYGDILLACEDALIAAQNSVVASESLGVGSCYIGDILENNKEITKLLNLDKFQIPISMVVYGYPTEQQLNRQKPKRFSREFIVHKNRYNRLSDKQIIQMFTEQSNKENYNFKQELSKFCKRKYMSDFAKEMNRSTREYFRNFE